MKSPQKLQWWPRTTLLSLAIIINWLLVKPNAYANSLFIQGSAPTQLNQAQLINEVESTQPLKLLVWIKPHNLQQLNDFLYQLYTPNSSVYHHFLTNDQFVAEYAPTSNEVSTVSNYLQQHKLRVTNVPDNRAYLEVQANAGQIEQLFKVKINNYLYQGRLDFSNNQDLSMEESIAPLIARITGLNNFNQVKNLDSSAPLAVLPKNLVKAYAIDKLWAKGLTGRGQTVAVVLGTQLTGVERNLAIFSQRNHLPSCTTSNGCLTLLDQYGNAANTSMPIGDNALETNLDVQAIHLVAPAAKIVMVGTSTAEDVDLMKAFNLIVSKNLASVISNSWAQLERAVDVYDFLFMQAAALGISINFGSGDNGAYLGSSTPAVAYPASSPWVTAIGGTEIRVTADGRYQSERGWVKLNSGSGAGGGISRYHNIPPWQQQALTNTMAIGIGRIGKYRAVPDISMDASPLSGIAVKVGTDDVSWLRVGGTSLSCPLFSGLVAIINQARQQRGLPPLGLVAPYVYRLPTSPVFGQAPIIDIVSPSSSPKNLLGAAPGWDDISGVGSPYAPKFVEALVNLN